MGTGIAILVLAIVRLDACFRAVQKRGGWYDVNLTW